MGGDELAPAFSSDFEECVAGHVLYTVVGFVHEFEELVDHGFQELPVLSEEARVLADHVHDARRDDGFVVFASFLFAEAKEFLKNRLRLKKLFLTHRQVSIKIRSFGGFYVLKRFFFVFFDFFRRFPTFFHVFSRFSHVFSSFLVFIGLSSTFWYVLVFSNPVGTFCSFFYVLCASIVFC